MHAYNCVVRPAGQVTHEVPKYKVSAKEVVMLRFIHGREGVKNIEQVGMITNYDVKHDLQHLVSTYGPERVHQVFNVSVDDMVDEMSDEKKSFVTDFAIIEEESKAASLTQISEEAGPSRPAPENSDSGPMIIGDPESRHAAKAVLDSTVGLE